jgi:hypothetical protein
VNIKEILDETNKIKIELEEKILSYLEACLVNASKEEYNKESDEKKTNMEIRCFLHCIRGLIFLNAEKLVEERFTRAVIGPLLKYDKFFFKFLSFLNFIFSYFRLHLTQGKIDGKEGRGSFSGLEDCLSTFLETIRKSRLIPFFNAFEDYSLECLSSSVENNSSSGMKIDFIVHGIWKPIATLLKEKFSSMFTIGITHIFSRCFLAIHSFLQDLSQLMVPTYQPIVFQRLTNHSIITKDFWKLWKFDLYYQLRFRELVTRLDRLGEFSYRNDHQGLTMALEQFYSSFLQGNNNSNKTITNANKSSAAVSTHSMDANLDKETVSRMGKQFLEMKNRFNFMNQFFDGFILELLLLIDPNIALPPLFSKFLLLQERIILRIGLQVILLTNDPTLASVALKMNKNEFDGVKLSLLKPPSTTTANHPQEGKAGDKKAAAPAASVPPAGPSAADQQLLNKNCTVDERILLTEDLLKFLLWFHQNYFQIVFAHPVLHTVNDNSGSSQLQTLIQTSFSGVVHKLLIVMHWSYRQIYLDIVQECLKPLTGIKAIAGKYRMTNKPAPTLASPYVTTIFSSFK